MPPSDSDSDIASFEEWVSETAQARNTSEQEVIDRMMSSYWILDELTGMLEETRDEKRREESSNRQEGETTEGRGQADGGGIDRELIELLNALVDRGEEASRQETTAPANSEAFMEEFREFMEREGRTEARDPGREFAAEIDGLREAIEGLGERSRRDPGRRLRRLSEQVADLEAELEDRLEEIEERIEDDGREGAASKRRVRRLSKRVSTLEDDLDDRLGTVEEQVEDADALRESVAELHEAVEDLDARLDEQASKGQLAELSNELESTEDRLAEQVRTLEADVESDLDSVEEILKYLLNNVDDLKVETESLRRAYAEIRPIVEDKDDVERLQRITDTANRAGIETAECDSCGSNIDIGLLWRPTCPHCDSSFDGLDTRSRLWRTTGTLTTGAPGDGPLPTQRDEPSSREPTEASAERSGDDGSPDFDWIE